MLVHFFNRHKVENGRVKIDNAVPLSWSYVLSLIPLSLANRSCMYSFPFLWLCRVKRKFRRENLRIEWKSALKKLSRSGKEYMWGCGRSPHPHIY
jgi:hypothetical protein